MANSNANTTIVQWSASGSRSLNSSARVDSDEITIHADAVQASLQVTANNSGTPAAGDVVNLWVKWSADGTTFDSDEHAMYLGQLDTVAANTPGEDPATRTFTLPVSARQRLRLSVVAPQGGSRAITVSAACNEHRMA